MSESEFVFVILILLPWAGGLCLISLTFVFAGLYAIGIIRFQAKRLDQFREENRLLHQECNRLDGENKDLTLKLQVAWIDTAITGREHDRQDSNG